MVAKEILKKLNQKMLIMRKNIKKLIQVHLFLLNSIINQFKNLHFLNSKYQYNFCKIQNKYKVENCKEKFNQNFYKKIKFNSKFINNNKYNSSNNKINNNLKTYIYNKVKILKMLMFFQLKTIMIIKKSI